MTDFQPVHHETPIPFKGIPLVKSGSELKPHPNERGDEELRSEPVPFGPIGEISLRLYRDPAYGKMYMGYTMDGETKPKKMADLYKEGYYEATIMLTRRGLDETTPAMFGTDIKYTFKLGTEDTTNPVIGKLGGANIDNKNRTEEWFIHFKKSLPDPENGNPCQAFLAAKNNPKELQKLQLQVEAKLKEGVKENESI